MFRLLIIFLLLCSTAQAQGITSVKNAAQHQYRHKPTDFSSVDSPSDEECATYESSTGQFEWQTCGGGSNDSGFTDGGTNVYTTTTTDLVGIGTTTPSATAELVKQGSVIPMMVSSAASGDGDYLVINSTGNVGIGTRSPVASALNVVGDELRVGNGGTNTNATSAGELYVQVDMEVDGTAFLTVASTPLVDLTGTGTINGLDAIDATGEATLESTLDIAGEVVSTGMASTVIADSVTVTGWAMGASTANTPAEDDNDTSIATTAYVQTEISGLSAGAGGWNDGGTNVYTTLTTDNVGIGTTTPSTTLEIVKVGSQPLLMASSAPTGDGDYLIVMSAGNVGIGTNNAGAALVIVRSDATINSLGATATPRLAILNQNSTVNNMSQVALQNVSSTGNVASGVLLTAIHENKTNGAITSSFKLETRNSNTFVEALRAKADGNIGLGTINPRALLHVGTGGTLNNASTNDVYIQNDLEVDGTIYGDGSGITNLSSGGWVDGGNNVYQSSTADSVGIGTTTPTTTLEIVKQSSNHPLMISSVPTGDGNLFIVTSGGNVGIGTTSDLNSLLNVNGSIATIGTATLSSFAGNVGVGTVNPRTLLDVATAGTRDNVGANDAYIQNDLEVDGTVYMGSCSGAGCGGGASGWTDGTNVVYTTVAEDNVGIGTAIPRQLLHIHVAGASGEPRLLFTNDDTTAGDDNQGFFFGLNDDESVRLNNQENNHIDILTNNTQRVRFHAGGNVGVGTISPQSIVHVNAGTGVGQLTLDGDTGGCLMFQDTDNAGWTECDVLNGVMSCSTDADGVCD